MSHHEGGHESGVKKWIKKQLTDPVDLACKVGIGFVIGVLSGVAF